MQTQLSYESPVQGGTAAGKPVHTAQPHLGDLCLWRPRLHRQVHLCRQPCPLLSPRTSWRWSDREEPLLSPPCRSTSSKTWFMKLWRTLGSSHPDNLISITVRYVWSWPWLCLLWRDTCHRDIVNLQVEMVRQFYIQLVRTSVLYSLWGRTPQKTPLKVDLLFQNEIHSLIEKYSVNESLVEEIERLKEENRRLKTNYWPQIERWGNSSALNSDSHFFTQNSSQLERTPFSTSPPLFSCISVPWTCSAS